MRVILSLTTKFNFIWKYIYTTHDDDDDDSQYIQVNEYKGKIIDNLMLSLNL